MRLVFIHEGYIYYNGQDFYSSAYNDENIRRYKGISDNITFITRTDAWQDKYLKDNHLTSKGFYHIGVNNFKTLKGLKNYFMMIRTINYCVKKCDYLIVRLPSTMGKIAIKYAKKYNKKYVTELVGCPWDSLINHSLIGKIVAPFSYLATKEMMKNSPYSVYVTKEFLQSRYATKGKSVACSDVTLPDTFDNALDKRIQKITNKNNQDLIIIGTIGDVSMKYKGHEFVIKAIAKLNKGKNKYEYHIVGPGNNERLKKIAENEGVIDHIKFKGSMEHNKVLEFLDNIDIYIQPSLTEGLPRSLIEAMSRGCYCLGTNVGGIPELLEEQFLFKRKNVEHIVKLINGIQKDDLLERAKSNITKSEEYGYARLSKLRNDFLCLYKGEVENEKQ